MTISVNGESFPQRGMGTSFRIGRPLEIVTPVFGFFLRLCTTIFLIIKKSISDEVSNWPFLKEMTSEILPAVK